MTVRILGRRFPAATTYVAALSAALLLLLVTVGGALWQTNRGVELNVIVREALETRGALRLVMRALQDAETGQRGYLLTGEEDYLGPYLAARAEVGTHLDTLREIAADNPVRVADAERIRELATIKMEELERTISLRRAGSSREALAVVRSDHGRATMDEIRALMIAGEQREGRLIADSMSRVDTSGERLRIVMLFATLLMVVIGALLVTAVRGAMTELRASRDAAEAARERVVQEMSGRVAAEEKVRQMQKMEAIGQLTGGVAHDFNNMLAVVISALQLAQRRISRGDADIGRFIDSAMDGARRAATLTSRLLAFARRAPLSPTVIDLNKVVAGMSDLLHRTLGETIALETVLAAGLWRVNADVSELENAILNICVNARDAMPDGGKLTIETINAFLDQNYAEAAVEVTPGQYVMLAITDTGGGMPPEVMAKAFEPFFTTKDVGKGTGLGLAHVHGFLKQSGGHAAIYSEIGHGTTVKLYLPRTQLPAQDPREQTLPQAAEDLPMGDAGTIVLVVEDEERVRNLSVAALRELGYTVLHADGGGAALDILAEKPGISLLFTDIVMAGMTGRKLADEAKSRHPHIKVLYTTGYTQNAIIHNGVVDADARLLMKPYGIADLARKVRAVLDE